MAEILVHVLIETGAYSAMNDNLTIPEMIKILGCLCRPANKLPYYKGGKSDQVTIFLSDEPEVVWQQLSWLLISLIIMEIFSYNMIVFGI